MGQEKDRLDEDRDTGKMIYQSPSCPLNLRRRVVIYTTTIQIIFSIAILGVLIENNFQVGAFGLLILFLYIFIFIGISLFLFTGLLYPHFEINSDGITKQNVHKYPYKEIHPDVVTLTYWEEIRFYDVRRTKKNSLLIMVYTGNRPIDSNVYSHPDKTVMMKLLNEIKEHRIPKRPIKCEHCGRLAQGLPYCVYCGFDRFKRRVRPKP